MDSIQAELEVFLDGRSEAVREKDLDRLMSFYAADIVYYDVVPPLQYVGTEALRGRFTHWFGSYQSGIRQDVHDLHILASGDVAVVNMLIRSGGTLADGREIDLWVRATSSCRRSNGSWSVTHEHISLPVDLQTGSVVRGLVP
jgi:ketosteroid isomerase-like protein